MSIATTDIEPTSHGEGCSCGDCCADRDAPLALKERTKPLKEMLEGLPEGSLEDFSNYLKEDGRFAKGKRLTTADEGPILFTFDTFEVPVETAAELNNPSLLEKQKAALRKAMETWETVANVKFKEVSGADVDQAVIKYLWGGPHAGGFHSGTNVKAGNYYTALHEIGHALGLGHGGNYNFDRGEPVFTNDSGYMTVMSYIGGIVGLGMADIMAIQDLYGAPKAENDVTAGDTVYGVGSDIAKGELVGWGQSDADKLARKPAFATIYDRDGIDTINLSDVVGQDMTIDLRDGGIIGNAENGYRPQKVFAVAKGTIIENVISGYGDDTIIGNDADNLLNGGFHDDVLTGNGGRDTFRVSADWGNDRIKDFQQGQDVVDFSASSGVTSMDDIKITSQGKHALISDANGNSILIDGMAGKITAKDIVFSSAGNDPTPSSVLIAADATYDEPDRYGKIRGSEYGHDTLLGGDSDDILVSNGNDTLIGGKGNDELRVGTTKAVVVVEDDWGNDTVIGARVGGWGQDHTLTQFQLDFSKHSTIRSLDDLTVTEETYAHKGYITVQVTVLSDGQGNSIRLDNFPSSALSDELFIFAEDETSDIPVPDGAIFGTDLNDEIMGTSGDDFIVGSAGADVFIGGSGTDTVSYRTSTEGVDARVYFWNTEGAGEAKGDWLFGIENLEGSSFDDILRGDTYDNVLTGGTGADRFVMGSNWGSDTITDFETTVDKIDFTETNLSFNDVKIYARNGDAVVSDGKGNEVILTGLANQVYEYDLDFA